MRNHIFAILLLAIIPLSRTFAYDKAEAHKIKSEADIMYEANDFISAYYRYQDYMDFLPMYHLYDADELCEQACVYYKAGRCAMNIGDYTSAIQEFNASDMLGNAFEDEVPLEIILSKIMYANCMNHEDINGHGEATNQIREYKEMYQKKSVRDSKIDFLIEANDLCYEFEDNRIWGYKGKMFDAYKRMLQLLSDKRMDELDLLEQSMLKNNCVFAAFNCEQYKTVIDITSEITDELIENNLTSCDEYNKAWYYSTACHFVAKTKLADFNTTLYIECIQDDIAEKYPRLTKKLRKGLWARYQHFLSDVVPYQASESKDMANSAYNAVLLIKGLLLDSSSSINRYVNASNNDYLKELLKQMNTLDEEASNDLSTFSSISSSEKCNAIDRKLMKALAAEGYALNNISISFKDIRDKLKENEVAIEFVRYDKGTRYLGEHDYQYIALVINRHSKDVALVELGSEDELKKYLEHPEQTADIWNALSDQIQNANRIFFSPDGVLATLPLESFISNREVFRLTSTRELYKQKRSFGTNKKALLIGGLDYDSSENITEKSNTSANISEELKRGMRASLGTLDYLPATEKEIKQISAIMDGKKQRVSKTKLVTGTQGSEQSFKQMSQDDYNIIHIATHGYSFPVKGEDSRAEGIGINYNFLTTYDDSKALMYSGLFFAGVNSFLEGEEPARGEDNNVFSALEASWMNLENCELLTLSACETAKGEYNSEGVFGLQRGFKIAGVQSILMSLWKVDDEATQALMCEFYTQWMNGKTKHDALELAKRKLRTSKEKWQDPKYWAAFVLLDAID